MAVDASLAVIRRVRAQFADSLLQPGSAAGGSTSISTTSSAARPASSAPIDATTRAPVEAVGSSALPPTQTDQAPEPTVTGATAAVEAPTPAAGTPADPSLSDRLARYRRTRQLQQDSTQSPVATPVPTPIPVLPKSPSAAQHADMSPTAARGRQLYGLGIADINITASSPPPTMSPVAPTAELTSHDHVLRACTDMIVRFNRRQSADSAHAVPSSLAELMEDFNFFRKISYAVLKEAGADRESLRRVMLQTPQALLQTLAAALSSPAGSPVSVDVPRPVLQVPEQAGDSIPSVAPPTDSVPLGTAPEQPEVVVPPSTKSATRVAAVPPPPEAPPSLPPPPVSAIKPPMPGKMMRGTPGPAPPPPPLPFPTLVPSVSTVHADGDSSINDDDVEDDAPSLARRNSASSFGSTPRSSRSSPHANAEWISSFMQQVHSVAGRNAGDAVRVYVRVRPFLDRETGGSRHQAVHAIGRTVSLRSSSDSVQFEFDSCFDGLEPEQAGAAGQEAVFSEVGMKALADAWNGFNASIIAYGQTGSGKSYCMMGPLSPAQSGLEGLIPRLCRRLFQLADHRNTTDSQDMVVVEASFVELYNEELRDLLNPDAGPLRIRESPVTGVVVQGLSKHVVRSYAEVKALLDEGNSLRVLAATDRNAQSSRSHTVFSLTITQARSRVSTIQLVDLAGAESAKEHRDAGLPSSRLRLSEASHINKSLFMLGHCMALLAAQSGAHGSGAGAEHIPYRNSCLTMLLRESLGGNARCSLIATVSPSAADHRYTLSTLRYADRARHIRTQARVNVQAPSQLIPQLQAEIRRLRALVAERDRVASFDDIPGSPMAMTGVPLDLNGDTDRSDPLTSDVSEDLKLLIESLEAHETQLASATMDWKQKRDSTRRLWRRRRELLARLGLLVGSATDSSLAPADFGQVQRSLPHLLSLSEDPMLSAALVHPLAVGITRVGREDAPIIQDIILGGLNILPEHCVIVSRVVDERHHFVEVTLCPRNGAEVYVNGTHVPPTPEDTDGFMLHHGDRIVFGHTHMFVFRYPSGQGGATSPSSTMFSAAAPSAAILEIAPHQAACQLQALKRATSLGEVDDDHALESDTPVESKSSTSDQTALEEEVAKALRLCVECNDMCASMNQDVVFEPELHAQLQCRDISSVRSIISSAVQQVYITATMIVRKPVQRRSSGAQRLPDHRSPGTSPATGSPPGGRGYSTLESAMRTPQRKPQAVFQSPLAASLVAEVVALHQRPLFCCPLEDFEEAVFQIRSLFEHTCAPQRYKSPDRDGHPPAALAPHLCDELLACFSNLQLFGGLESKVGGGTQLRTPASASSGSGRGEGGHSQAKADTFLDPEDNSTGQISQQHQLQVLLEENSRLVKLLRQERAANSALRRYNGADHSAERPLSTVVSEAADISSFAQLLHHDLETIAFKYVDQFDVA